MITATTRDREKQDVLFLYSILLRHDDAFRRRGDHWLFPFYFNVTTTKKTNTHTALSTSGSASSLKYRWAIKSNQYENECIYIYMLWRDLLVYIWKWYVFFFVLLALRFDRRCLLCLFVKQTTHRSAPPGMRQWMCVIRIEWECAALTLRLWFPQSQPNTLFMDSKQRGGGGEGGAYI